MNKLFRNVDANIRRNSEEPFAAFAVLACLRDRTGSCSSSEIAWTGLAVLCDDHNQWRKKKEWISNFLINALKNSIRPYAPAWEKKKSFQSSLLHPQINLHFATPSHCSQPERGYWGEKGEPGQIVIKVALRVMSFRFQILIISFLKRYFA